VRRAGEAPTHRLKGGRGRDDPQGVTDLASPPAAVLPDAALLDAVLPDAALPDALGVDPVDLGLEQLRRRRAALVERASRAARWRRLVQARLDLAVDAAVPVEELGGPWPSLRALVHGESGGDVVAQLAAAAVVRRDLGRWCAEVEDELAETTGELVERYRLDPSRCLPAQRR